MVISAVTRWLQQFTTLESTTPDATILPTVIEQIRIRSWKDRLAFINERKEIIAELLSQSKKKWASSAEILRRMQDPKEQYLFLNEHFYPHEILEILIDLPETTWTPYTLFKKRWVPHKTYEFYPEYTYIKAYLTYMFTETDTTLLCRDLRHTTTLLEQKLEKRKCMLETDKQYDQKKMAALYIYRTQKLLADLLLEDVRNQERFMQSYKACEKAIAALEKSNVSLYLGTELLERGMYTMLYAEGHTEEASNKCMKLMEDMMLQKPTWSAIEKLIQRKTLLIDCMFDFVQLNIDSGDSLPDTDSVNRLAKFTQAKVWLEELDKLLQSSREEKVITSRHTQRWNFLKGWYYWIWNMQKEAEQHFRHLSEDFFLQRVDELRKNGKTTFVQKKKHGASGNLRIIR